MRIENWQIFDFKSRKIDVVLISFWLFKAEITRKIIYEQIAPKKVIVNQILQSDSEKEVSELSVKFPDVIFVNKPMVSTEF